MRSKGSASHGQSHWHGFFLRLTRNALKKKTKTTTLGNEARDFRTGPHYSFVPKRVDNLSQPSATSLPESCMPQRWVRRHQPEQVFHRASARLWSALLRKTSNLPRDTSKGKDKKKQKKKLRHPSLQGKAAHLPCEILTWFDDLTE